MFVVAALFTVVVCFCCCCFLFSFAGLRSFSNCCCFCGILVAVFFVCLIFSYVNIYPKGVKNTHEKKHLFLSSLLFILE